MLTYASLLEPIRPISPPPLLSDQQDSTPLCTHCENIATSFKEALGYLARGERIKPVKYALLDHYPNFPNLKTSAEQGCTCCALLRYTVRKNWSHRPFTEYSVGDLDGGLPVHSRLLAAEWDGEVSIGDLCFGRSSTNSRQVDLLTMRIAPSMYNETKGFRVIEEHDTIDTLNQISAEFALKVFKLAFTLKDNLVDALRLPSEETLSEQNLELMHQWLHACDTMHVVCSVSEPLRLPTRVIDVGRSSSGSPKPYLLCSDGIEGRYAALSHCWGTPSASNPGFKTETHNYHNMQAGFALEGMPALFQDAIVATWKLGIQYLWIDSLCIIQDSTDDWELESAKMGSIYRNAYVTIVATSATASNQSFLERSIHSMPAAKVAIPPTNASQKPTHIYLNPRTEPYDGGVWTGDVVDSTWNQRGWCMQETMLSRRLLHFCKNKIYFECREILTSEENEVHQRSLATRPSAAGMANLSAIRLLPLDISRPKKLLQADDPSQPLKLSSGDTLARTWETIMQQYSRRELTYPSDRLPALSGLASHYAKLTDHNYLAGLWREDLAQLLLWSLDPQIAPFPLPPRYRAPSWSWASLDGRIIMPSARCSKPSSLLILEARTRPSGLDPSGAVESGHLKVSGLMLRIDFVPEYNHFDRFVSYNRSRFPYDLEIENKTNGERLKVGECHLDRDDVSLLRPDIWYLEIYSDRANRPTGLLLQTINTDGSEFVRVGIVSTIDHVKGRYTTFSDASVLTEAQRRTITIF